MIMTIGERSCRQVRWRSFPIAFGVVVFSIAGCTELDPAAQSGNGDIGAEEQTTVQPVLLSSARQGRIDPSMRPDPQAFHATGLGIWDGRRTLPGAWVAYPMAEIARRVRLTNDETGAQTDAAMFRRNPNLSGPRIIVSSEAAEWLGLIPGHATPITIDGLTYRSDTKAASATASPVEEPATPPTEVPAQEAAYEPAAREVAPDAALSTDPPAAHESAAADAGPLDAGPINAGPINAGPADAGPMDAAAVNDQAESGPDPSSFSTVTARVDAEPGPITPKLEPTPEPTPKPTPKPEVIPAEPVPDASGEITDGRHFIQAGIFGQPENATRLVKKLRAADLPAGELPLILSGRPLTRVLIGPYQTIAEREAALETVRRLGPPDATFIREPAQATTQNPTQG